MNLSNRPPREPTLDIPVDLSTGREKPDGMVEPAAEAGWFLQRERESRDLTLEQAGEMVGVHPYHLEAIEYGDMTHMPSRAEALEMIAAYASFLGFEPEPLLEHYLSFLPVPQVAPRHHPAQPAPLSSAKILNFGRFVKLPAINIKLPNLSHLPKMPGGNNGNIVASVAAAFLLFSGLVWTMMPGAAPQQTSEQIALQEPSDPMPTASTGTDEVEVKVTETPMDGEALATVDGEVGGAQPDIIVDAPALDPDILGAFIQQNVTGAPNEPAIAAEIPVAAAEGRVFGSSDAKVRVVLKAIRPIWLLIEDGKNNRVATQLLNAGDMYRVPDRPGLVATVQDGGAIKYIIDGQEKGVLGQPGSVLAAEPLDVNKLEARS